MKKQDVDDYLQEGIYGGRQTKPGERKQYLGTLRERIVLVLTKGQVMQEAGVEELKEKMKEHKDAQLLLNGEVSYRFRKPYRNIADQYDIHHTTISNHETDTDAGAILTVGYAIEKEDIYLETKEEPREVNRENKGVIGFLKSLFKSSE
ncbi:YueI family protein [Halobacillus sp. A5]|uniref:YueI family protein n=1 Tax=Halobacillus sp. A5 TaxID=2880263 RepID=UPI0020A6CD64|nr:YueI family protein [Halobacillus sp. A5]MCP3028565.1 YueI family protein [Halobacillus sp. A5]